MPSKFDSHSVTIHSRISPKLDLFIKKQNYSAYFIICDSNTLNYCMSDLILACKVLRDAEIIEIEPGEQSKELEVAGHIWQTLTDFAADKKSLVVNLGGGVVSDIGGFAASTFKRGIDFINVPTSLLSMADASVGGKTGINFSGIKNQIGTITQPKAVFINTGFLKTLPFDHLISGFAEIIKIALISDKSFFSKLSQLLIENSFSDSEIIKQAVQLKSSIVNKDPDEKGLRKILNFGHTIGHAVESLFLEKSEPLLHGEAIAIGMAIESYLCLLLKRITKAEFEKIISCLKLNFHFPEIEEQDQAAFFEFFKQDKKHLKNAYLLALLKGIGKCDFNVKVSLAQVQKALYFYNTELAHAD